ncbi:MAG: DUF3021 domain-containing protein [Oscillospiraceae bacterium]|nr:DUF3021 domain-containing protein [Oscillospiraceae bacterium]
MKKFWKEFLLRGLICAAGGPVMLAIIFGILGYTGTVESIPANEVCLGILTITLLAFIAAGMTAIYQMEQLPLPTMILIHGGALYIAYLLTYLINGWLLNQVMPILIFTGIFVVGYALIWSIIYLIERKKIQKLNKLLQK